MPPNRVVVGLLVGVVLSACSGSGSRDSPPPTSVESGGALDAASEVAPVSVEPPEVVRDGPLEDVCPSRLTVQTASLPTAVLGPLYRLLGPDPTVDPESQSVGSTLVRPDGTESGIELELRVGGPAVGFVDPLDLLSADASIDLAQVSTASAISDDGTTPAVAVVSLTDRSPAAIVFDPGTYPGVASMSDVQASGAEVRVFTASPVIAFLVANGSLAADQLIDGFDGEPAAFVVGDGELMQQGDLTVEPVLYPTLPQWNRPVGAVAASDAGWVSFDDSLVVRASDQASLHDCLLRFVPVVQRSIAAYAADPGPTNVVMSDVRSRFAPLARLTPELMDAGAAAAVANGVFGNGTNSTVGDFDLVELGAFVPSLASALDVSSPSLEALVTNTFIEPSVSFSADG